MNEKHELHNRNLHISGLLNEEKVDIGDKKIDIENTKVDIQDKKVDIESVLSEKGSDFSVKTMVHIHRLFEKFGFDEVFGRSAVMGILELKSSGASKLLSKLIQADIIEPVSGHGKGKYKFNRLSSLNKKAFMGKNFQQIYRMTKEVLAGVQHLFDLLGER